MTFRDLLKKYSYKTVFNIIHQLYYKDKSSDVIYMDDACYRKVFKKLLLLEPAPPFPYHIHLKEEDEGIMVNLYCPEEEEVYGIDFTPWESLIDAPIFNMTTLKGAEILAHILWEITFYGYTPAAIQEVRDHLDDLLEK
tara:strand:- start:667 stop:1083 length:417 start_codon:yes stop_codon:yes gene_type:complete